jgi:hypothetical protein
MLDLIILAGLFAILGAVLYGIYLIPPVKRAVRGFARKRFDLLVTLTIGTTAALALYFIILPRMG